MNNSNIELRIISNVEGVKLESKYIRSINGVDDSFDHMINKRSGDIDSTVIIAIISAASTTFGIIISNLLEYYKSRYGKKVIIKVKDKDKEINLEFSAEMSPDEIKKYIQEISSINECDLVIIEK